MSKKADLQKEALKELMEYSDKLLLGIQNVVSELRDNKKPDTDEMLNLVIQGINWEIEVFNHTEELINKDMVNVDKSKMAASVTRLGKVLQEKDDIKIAACLEVDFVPFVKAMEQTARTICA